MREVVLQSSGIWISSREVQSCLITSSRADCMFVHWL